MLHWKEKCKGGNNSLWLIYWGKRAKALEPNWGDIITEKFMKTIAQHFSRFITCVHERVCVCVHVQVCAPVHVHKGQKRLRCLSSLLDLL